VIEEKKVPQRKPFSSSIFEPEEFAEKMKLIKKRNFKKRRRESLDSGDKT